MPQSFKRKTSQNVGNQVIVGNYTVPAGVSATVFGLTACNNLGIDTNVTIFHYDGSTRTNIVLNAPIKPGGTLVPIGWAQRLALQPGDSIYAISSNTNGVDIIMSVLELS